MVCIKRLVVKQKVLHVVTQKLSAVYACSLYMLRTTGSSPCPLTYVIIPVHCFYLTPQVIAAIGMPMWLLCLCSLVQCSVWSSSVCGFHHLHLAFLCRCCSLLELAGRSRPVRLHVLYMIFLLHVHLASRSDSISSGAEVAVEVSAVIAFDQSACFHMHTTERINRSTYAQASCCGVCWRDRTVCSTLT